MIFNYISDNIPPKMNILDMVIPILMHFCAYLLFVLSQTGVLQALVIQQNVIY